MSVKWTFIPPKNSALFDTRYAKSTLPPVYRKAIEEITGVVYSNIFFRTPVAGGDLRNSEQTEVKARTGRVYFVAPGSRYAAFAEEGRAPGKNPPISPLIRWIKSSRQGRSYLSAVASKITKGRRMSIAKVIRSAAFMLANSIGKKGTKGKFFFQGGVDASQSAINNITAKLLNAAGRLLQ